MAFNSDKDKLLAEVASIDTGSTNEGPTSIVVEAMQYNGGEPKLQITRTYTSKEGLQLRAKLGRVRFEEVPGLIEALEKGRMFLDEVKR